MSVGSNQYLLLVGSVKRTTVTEWIKAPFWYQGPLGSKKMFFLEQKSHYLSLCTTQKGMEIWRFRLPESIHVGLKLMQGLTIQDG